MIITNVRADHPKFTDRLINKSLSLILREHLYSDISESDSVRFSYDSDLNLYAMCNPVWAHRINSEMPITIVDSYREKRPRMGFRKRLLMFGKVEVVEGEELKTALAGYYKRHPREEGKPGVLHVLRVNKVILLDESTFGVNESFTFHLWSASIATAA